jgi:hypothetical protein
MADSRKDRRGVTKDDVRAWMAGKASPLQQQLIELDLERPDSAVREYLEWLSDPNSSTRPPPRIVREWIDGLPPKTLQDLDRLDETGVGQGSEAPHLKVHWPEQETASERGVQGEPDRARGRIGPSRADHPRVKSTPDPDGPSR